MNNKQRLYIMALFLIWFEIGNLCCQHLGMNIFFALLINTPICLAIYYRKNIWKEITYCPPASCYFCGSKKNLRLSLIGDMHIHHLCPKHVKRMQTKGLLQG